MVEITQKTALRNITVIFQEQPGLQANLNPALQKALRAIGGFLHAVDGTTLVGTKPVESFFNEAACRIFGYRTNDIIGRHVSLLMPLPHSDSSHHSREPFLQTGTAGLMGHRREVEGMRKNGTLFPMDIHLSEVQWGNRCLFTGIIRDITDFGNCSKRSN
jgi:two-component system, LuxR family, sensor kinase FixL